MVFNIFPPADQLREYLEKISINTKSKYQGLRSFTTAASSIRCIQYVFRIDPFLLALLLLVKCPRNSPCVFRRFLFNFLHACLALIKFQSACAWLPVSCHILVNGLSKLTNVGQPNKVNIFPWIEYKEPKPPLPLQYSFSHVHLTECYLWFSTSTSYSSNSKALQQLQTCNLLIK